MFYVISLSFKQISINQLLKIAKSQNAIEANKANKAKSRIIRLWKKKHLPWQCVLVLLQKQSLWTQKSRIAPSFFSKQYPLKKSESNFIICVSKFCITQALLLQKQALPIWTNLRNGSKICPGLVITLPWFPCELYKHEIFFAVHSRNRKCKKS